MNRVLLALALALGMSWPAFGACSKSPFSGFVTCDYGDTSDPFANERVEWPKKQRCETKHDYYRGVYITECQEQ